MHGPQYPKKRGLVSLETNGGIRRTDSRTLVDRWESKNNLDGPGGTREALENEAADLFGQLVLYLRQNDIDIEAAIERKWLRHLNQYVELDKTAATDVV
jgi:hypothetical protein